MIHPVSINKLLAIHLLLIISLLLTGCPTPEADAESEGEETGFLEMINSGLEEMTSSLAGTVYIDGRPQAYGTIQVWDEEENLVAQERANGSGHFRITDLKAQRYYIRYLNASGAYFGEPIMVQLRPGRPEVLDLELSSDR